MTSSDPSSNGTTAGFGPRRQEVEHRQKLIAERLHREGADAVLLFEPDSFAWFTAGGRMSQQAGPTGQAFLFLTPTDRCLVTSCERTSWFLTEELDELGFYLKELPWWQPVDTLIPDLCGKRKVLCDRYWPGTIDARSHFSELRLHLTPFDQDRCRQLARTLATVLEQVCRAIEPGQTELEVRGQLMHRMVQNEIEPIAIHLFCDDRAAQFGRPLATMRPIERFCSILATGMSGGLTVTTSRTVAFGSASDELRHNHRVAALLASAALRFSLPGANVNDILRMERRILLAHGREFVETMAPFGGLVGYTTSATPFSVNGSGTVLAEGHAVAWTPVVEGMSSAESCLVLDGGVQPLCYPENWPLISVAVGDATVNRPGILIRP